MQEELQKLIDLYISDRNGNNRNKLIIRYIPEIKKIIRRIDTKKTLETNDILHDCLARLIEVLPLLEECTATTGYIATIITNHVKRKIGEPQPVFASDEILEHIESEPHNEDSIIQAVDASRVLEKINKLALTESEKEAIAIASGEINKGKGKKYQRAIKSVRQKLGLQFSIQK